MQPSKLNLRYFTQHCDSFRNNRKELASSIAIRLQDNANIMDTDIFNLLKNGMYAEAKMLIAYKSDIDASKLLKWCIDHQTPIETFRFVADICPIIPQLDAKLYPEDSLDKFSTSISYYKKRDAYIKSVFQSHSSFIIEEDCDLTEQDKTMISANAAIINTASDYQTFVNELFSNRIEALRDQGRETADSHLNALQ